MRSPNKRRRSCWSGRPDGILEPLAGDLEVIAASEVIAMDADAGASVRRMKDSSLVRAAEAVRDGRASAMVSAGNTGATMGSALLRMGRIKGVKRAEAIAIADPRPRRDPTVLLDAGANAECTALVAPAPVRPDGHGVLPGARLRRVSDAPRRPALDRRRCVEGHAALVEETPRAPRRLCRTSHRRRWPVHRQRRGTRPDDRRGRRRRHRRVHGQRGAEDARRRAPRSCRAHLRSVSGPARRPGTPAEVLLPALAPPYAARRSTPTTPAATMLLGVGSTA